MNNDEVSSHSTTPTIMPSERQTRSLQLSGRVQSSGTPHARFDDTPLTDSGNQQHLCAARADWAERYGLLPDHPHDGEVYEFSAVDRLLVADFLHRVRNWGSLRLNCVRVFADGVRFAGALPTSGTLEDILAEALVR